MIGAVSLQAALAGSAHEPDAEPDGAPDSAEKGDLPRQSFKSGEPPTESFNMSSTNLPQVCNLHGVPFYVMPSPIFGLLHDI